MHTAIVTGAGSGIGRYSALALLQNNFRVILSGRTSETLAATLDAAGKHRDQALIITADISDPAQVAHLFQQARAAFKRLDLLFNNAGTNIPGIPLEEVSPAQWNSVISTNLSGAFYCTQQAFNWMKDQDPQGGRIINNGSISAHVPRPNSAPYTASKHAMTGLSKSTSLDGAKVQHRLLPDRHRQCADPNGCPNAQRCPAGGWLRRH